MLEKVTTFQNPHPEQSERLTLHGLPLAAEGIVQREGWKFSRGCGLSHKGTSIPRGEHEQSSCRPLWMRCAGALPLRPEWGEVGDAFFRMLVGMMTGHGGKE